MNQVQVEQKSYQMPPQDGFTVAYFLTVADIERSARFYETVFGGRILSRGDSSGAPGYIQIANTWLIVNVGGGPTPAKPSITLSVPADPDSVSSFMMIRVADIQACYELWRNRGAEFITEPKDNYGEMFCYIRDPDGYIIEVGQSKPTIEGEPSRISMCHCLECQRRTDAVISNQARFRREQVTFGGKATVWKRTAESGNALTFHFCPTCGSTVYWEGEGFPGYVAVAIGSFAEPNFPAPTIAVWEESRHPWISLPPDMPPKRVAKQG